MPSEESKVQNFAQVLTSEQVSRSFITIVASGYEMADGTRQTPSSAMVRMRDGSYKYIHELPPIDRANPQPNGDYILPLINDHESSVGSQSGAIWLWLEDSMLYGLVVFSNNEASENLIPLARDGFLQFSTEGYVQAVTDGAYEDFWITGVAPVLVGNDPATQVIAANALRKLANMQIETEAQEEESGIIEMSENTIEVQAVPEPVIAEPVQVENKITGQDWLKTENAMTAFVDALKAGNAQATMSKWRDTLVENAVTFNPDSVEALPELLVTEINTIITTNGEIYGRLNHTGLMWAVGASTSELEAAKVRARGASTTKTSQSVVAETRIIQPTAFYKFLSQAYDVVVRNGGLSGAIATFAARELAMKVLELIERAVIVGGVKDDAGTTISPTFVQPVSADTVANGVYGDVYTQAAGESLPESISTAAAMVLSGGAVSLITTRARAAKLPYLTVGEAGIPMFLNSAERGSVNIPMVDSVIAPVWLTEDDLGGGIGYLVDLSAIKTVGETGTQSFYQFHMRTNEHDFEAIKMFGAAISKPKAAVKVMPAA